jgi:NADH-quinone oxidoreductase subunit L
LETALSQKGALILYTAIAAVLLPFAAFAINFLLPKTSKIAGWVSVVAISMACVLSVNVFTQVWNVHEVHARLLWFSIGSTRVYAGIFLNNLSALMLVLVSVIALPVHIYSTAYMKHDGHYSRYFTYLSFFCFSMLALVIVDNLVLLYAFWELVGFSSYLLIGFWYTRDKAVQANKKAFIMNRIGDTGLLIAIIILFVQFNTFDLGELFGANGMVKQAIISDGVWYANGAMCMPGSALAALMGGSIPAVWQYVACAGLFLAVAAKSAQFPLHTWLPDAMEGPTSVSALIHAATMVAAGVFLLGRVYPFFIATELDILAIIGCFTAFMAATIALTQNDLKRILAYSTISQLGFMIMGMGIGAYPSALFHLTTHAFFKCLLFLCAGIIIHEMQHIKEENKLDIDAQDILNMGGLRKQLPVTFWASVIGGLALIGLPLTSGYLSKDGILIEAFQWSDGRGWPFKILPAAALITSWMTAFYVARLIFKVFFGKFRLLEAYPDVKLHASDKKWQYRLPLILLSVCCLFPLFSVSPFVYEHAWLFKGFSSTNAPALIIYHNLIPVGVNVLSLCVIYYAYLNYVSKPIPVFQQKGFAYRLSYHQWYIDRFYSKYIVTPVLVIGKAAFAFDRKVIDGFISLLQNITINLSKLSAWIDKYLVDGMLYLIVLIVKSVGNFARGFQGGKVQYYLFSMLVIVLAIFIYKTLI